MAAGRTWPGTVAALVAGVALGVSSLSAGALLLYTGEGLLSSVGFLLSVALLSLAAGVWVAGAPVESAGAGRAEGTGPAAPTPSRRVAWWTAAILALVAASFVAMAWLRYPDLQKAPWAPPLGVVVLVVSPGYAIAGLLKRLGSAVRGGAVVPALVGVSGGVAVAAAWLVPAFPPGPVFVAAALLLTGAGWLEIGLSAEWKEGRMAERVFLVTGVGSPGQVGFTIAEALVAEGGRVAITSRREDVGELARTLGGDVLGVTADLAEEAGAAAVIAAVDARWGRLDGLVNVAGGLRATGPVSETSPEAWQRELDANARTAFLASRAALPLLRASRGAIVNFASPAGERAAKGMAAYSAAKAAVVALTRALALEERETGVRVNAVAPGMVDTAQNRDEVADPEGTKWVTRGQLASVVLFLLGEGGSGINGQVVGVPGEGLR